MVGEPVTQSPIRRSAPLGNQSVSRSEDLPGLGGGRAMSAYEAKAEEKTNETVIQKTFDELPAP